MCTTGKYFSSKPYLVLKKNYRGLDITNEIHSTADGQSNESQTTKKVVETVLNKHSSVRAFEHHLSTTSSSEEIWHTGKLFSQR